MREQIAVYGSGTIGSCEATLIIGHGVPCTVIGHSERGLDRCRNAVAQNWDDLIAEGLATEANKQAALALLTVTNDPAALKDHTFVFEAVTEGAAEKQSAYAAIAQYAAQDAIIASCSSSMDAEILADLTPCPERLLIAHPFQPVHMLPLVEVVRHRRTQEEVVSRTLTLLEQLHRQVVVLNRSVPGLLVNRFAQALFRESIYLIEQGVTTAADIDRAVKYAVGMRYASIGLLEYFDAVGFQLESTIAQNATQTCAAPGNYKKRFWRDWHPARPARRRGRGSMTGRRRTRMTSAAASRVPTSTASGSGPCQSEIRS